MNFIQFKSILIYTLESRKLFLLLCAGVLLILFIDLSGYIEIQTKRDGIWAKVLSHYIAFGTFIVAFAAWISTVKHDWKERLPKRLSVQFIHKYQIVMQCDFAYLSGESDIRQMGQQVGAQMANLRYLNFNIANVVWKEKEIIYQIEQIPNCDKAFFNEKLPFRHYIVQIELSSLPENLDEGYQYIWFPPFDICMDEKDKENKLQYNKKQLLKLFEGAV